MRISHFFVVIVSVSEPTINFARIKFIAFSTDMISLSQYIIVEKAFLKINVAPIIPYFPFIELQSFAEKVFLEKLIDPEVVRFLPFRLSIIQVPFLIASRGDIFLVSQGRVHLFSLAFQLYPADPMHP